MVGTEEGGQRALQLVTISGFNSLNSVMQGDFE
jgi:hypothetical protein